MPTFMQRNSHFKQGLETKQITPISLLADKKSVENGKKISILKKKMKVSHKILRTDGNSEDAGSADDSNGNHK